ncbi:DUF3397 domain-containing protein [Listeria costaricensis]|uniref:DUF3397 domain-containing protein n=1 Tax=Listeria costaricensis TaxID=2026604 RepID=UPI000C07E20F|nr:DUF3397 domain-containing protein [Listeria costaricensis]
MLNWLKDPAAWLIILPIIVFIAAQWLIKKRTHKKQKSIKLAADISTFFFILADHVFMLLVFEKSYLLYILLGLFIVGIVLVSVQATREGELHFDKVLRGFWRICFMVFALLYLVLFIIGVIQSLLFLVG